MKKFFYYAALFAALTMGFSSCGEKNGGDDIDDPDEEEFVSPIKVDGDFADWAALPAAKVAVAENKNAEKNALKVLKAYADKVYLNIYFEFDDAQIVDKSWPAVHVYLNYDGDKATGGYGDEFADACVDSMLAQTSLCGTIFFSLPLAVCSLQRARPWRPSGKICNSKGTFAAA